MLRWWVIKLLLVVVIALAVVMAIREYPGFVMV